MRRSKILPWAGMDNSWQTRLQEAVVKDGRKPRKIALDAGLGPNYVEQVLKPDKDPRLAQLVKLCAELRVSPIWVLFGINLTPESEEVVQLLAGLPEEARQSFLNLVRHMPR